MTRRLAAIALLLLCFALPTARAEDAASARLPERFGFTAEEASWLLLDPGSGVELEAHLADRPRIPASTAKLATAVAALDVLGGELRLATELLATGAIEGGVLRGDLVLRGGGDPLLDVADLFDLALALRQRGVRGIGGRFLLDDGMLPRFPRIAPSEPESAPYNAGVAALTVDFARVRLVPTDPPTTVPPLFEARLVWSDRPVPPPETARLVGDGDGAVWHIPRGGRARALPVRDAGRHAAMLFRRLAEGLGIPLPLPVRGTTPADAVPLARKESAPLRRIVRGMLLYSNNQVAEILGLSTSRRLIEAPPVSLEASAARILAHLRKRLPGTDWSDARLVNHSGLGAASRLTPRQLTALLAFGDRRFRLAALLPASGWVGTLRRRLEAGATALRIWAKTGTIDYASTIAGYLLPEDGRMRAFAIMLDDQRARARYDRKPVKSAAMLQAADRWNQRARAFQDALLARWLER